MFLRHAEVETAYHRVFGGRIDMGISELGARQAEALAHFVHRKFQLDAIYASPMRRVRMTLEPLLGRVTVQPRLLDGLREVDFGDWTGLGWEAVRERYGASAFEWLDHLDRGTMSGAEPAHAFRARVQAALEHILHEARGKTVAVACHGGVIRMALSALLEMPLPKMRHLEVDYASVTWVDCHEHKREVQLHNLVPWRDL